MVFCLTNNIAIKVKMSWNDMFLEALSIILVIALWAYQVSVQALNSTFFDSENGGISSIIFLWIHPVNGTLVLLLSLVLISHPENFPQFGELSEARQAQRMYSRFISLVCNSKINALLYFLSQSYSYSQIIRGQEDVKYYPQQVYFIIQIIIFFGYIVSVIYILCNIPQKIMTLANEEESEEIDIYKQQNLQESPSKQNSSRIHNYSRTQTPKQNIELKFTQQQKISQQVQDQVEVRSDSFQDEKASDFMAQLPDNYQLESQYEETKE